MTALATFISINDGTIKIIFRDRVCFNNLTSSQMDELVDLWDQWAASHKYDSSITESLWRSLGRCEGFNVVELCNKGWGMLVQRLHRNYILRQTFPNITEAEIIELKLKGILDV